MRQSSPTYALASVSNDLIVLRREGLYCPEGDFYIDPWRPVGRAIITHAHADHARVGHASYLAATPGERVLRARLGDISLETIDYGESRIVNGVRITLFPAGHVLGSAQVRLEANGVTWAASGDYKTAGLNGPAEDRDGTCASFEPVTCDVFITESTFGLPIYRWQPQSFLISEINQWWRANAEAKRASVLFCYAFGKAQRLLAAVDASIGPIVCHGAVQALNTAYRESGVSLPETHLVSELEPGVLSRALVVAPPSAASSPWLKRFGDYSDAFASGWMQLRGARRRRSLDRGFVVSDHADWPGLRMAIAATGAPRVIVTHGQVAPLVRALRDEGIDASAFETEYGDEEDDDGDETAATAAAVTA
jgi:putative mRNA 3-end processing factor